MLPHEARRVKDLKEIKRWTEDRGGKPAKVKGVGGGKEGEGMLRIDFPGFSGEDSLEEITWEEWYKIFEKRDLTFLYQEKTVDGGESHFFKLISNS
ncbi:MAG: hypothetical protein ABIN94_02535 [Ferruginibacter sp.]